MKWQNSNGVHVLVMLDESVATLEHRDGKWWGCVAATRLLVDYPGDLTLDEAKARVYATVRRSLEEWQLAITAILHRLPRG